jgi:hypothetical protein
MNLLTELRERDVRLVPQGDALKVNAPRGRLTAELLDRLRRCKWELLAIMLIDQESDPDRQADLRYAFEERAAISEYDGGLDRVEAERAAYRELIRTMEGGQ